MADAPTTLKAVDTGNPKQDAETDFSRARRRQQLSRLRARLRGEPGEVGVVLPFDEVIAALGNRGEKRLGLQTIELDSIVGSVDREREFDREFRPKTARLRGRWQGIAEATRRGKSLPPIDVYRIGDLHFVRDGHHRVSVARHLGLDKIDAQVTEIKTAIGGDREITLADLPLKSHERLFFERVPLKREHRSRISMRNGWDYAGLAEGVEAWGFRVMQARGEFMTREEVAEAWFHEDYLPVTEMIAEAELTRRGTTETEAYARVVSLRYLLLRTHDWNDGVIERLRAELDHTSGSQDTFEQRLRSDLN